MLCALTVRKLKPGAYEDFRRAWQPDPWPGRLLRAYHVRSVDDENQVISFGFFDGTLEELREAQREGNYEAQQERITPFVESIRVDGLFEVVEEVKPPQG